MKVLKISLLFLVVSLSGCAGMNGDFNCNKIGGEGAGCVSMNQVNTMANEGFFNQKQNTLVTPSASTSIQVSQTETINKKLGYTRAVPTAGRPTRTVDVVDRIWFAPYKDKEDNYHDSNFVYTVITYSHWNDYPVSAIQKEDD